MLLALLARPAVLNPSLDPAHAAFFDGEDNAVVDCGEADGLNLPGEVGRLEGGDHFRSGEFVGGCDGGAGEAEVAVLGWGEGVGLAGEVVRAEFEGRDNVVAGCVEEDELLTHLGVGFVDL